MDSKKEFYVAGNYRQLVYHLRPIVARKQGLLIPEHLRGLHGVKVHRIGTYWMLPAKELEAWEREIQIAELPR